MSTLLVRRWHRYNYTTPRSFLELIHFFKSMLASKRSAMARNIGRLSSGLITLQKTNRDVQVRAYGGSIAPKM
jgi:hypothetical protein